MTHAQGPASHDAAKCGAAKKQGERGPCQRPAGWGTDHVGVGCCKLHGGSSPSGVVAGQRALAEKVLRASVTAYGLPDDIDPGTALLDEVKRTAGHVRWLQEKIQSLDPDNLIRGTRSVKRTVGQSVEGPVDVTATEVGPLISVWLELYLRERKHLAAVCKSALDAGIAERQIQLAEQAGERAGQWLQASLSVLGLSDVDLRRVMNHAVTQLHLLEGS